jgi:hypothetical protein
MAQNTSAQDFGSLLRQYRRTATDPQRGGTLTQERLGELLGEALGGAGYSGAAISEWERNRSKIEKDQRKVLVALILMLRQYNGLTCRNEADQLLLVGNYRPLDDQEAQQIFPGESFQSDTNNALMHSVSDPLQAAFRIFLEKSQRQKTLVNNMPWYEALLIGMGKASEQVSAELVLKSILWCAIGWLSWRMLAPIMTWPFESTSEAWRAAVSYGAGTIIIPLLIAGMCCTNQVAFWQEQEQTNNSSLRFFTHLGASVGYQVGTMITVCSAILIYDIGGLVLSPWLPGIGSIFALLIGLASARQIPYNQWRAYHKLHWKDAGVFATFFMFGPFAATAFFLYYPWLLSPFPGLLLITIAVVVLAVSSIVQRRNH